MLRRAVVLVHPSLDVVVERHQLGKIFLVGAAWAPWGLRAVDRLLRRGRRLGAAELAAVLALQVLGGDPEAAYLTAACGENVLLSCMTIPAITRIAVFLLSSRPSRHL